jgi:multiple sugar transport system permease protein
MSLVTRMKSKKAKDAYEATPGHRNSKVTRISAYVALTGFLLATLYPFWFMVRTAFSTNRKLSSDPLSILPVDFTTGAFERVLGLASTDEALAEGGSGQSLNFLQYMFNSLVSTTGATVSQVIFSAAAAYAFGVLSWKGRDPVFFLFLFALTVPAIFLVLPNYLFVRELGLLNTLAGVMAPHMLMAPFAVFFLRQVFLSTNLSIVEAAIIDGASHLRIFFQIVLPMARSQVITVFILQYITIWNDYLWPLYVGSSEESSRTLTVALGVFKSQTPEGLTDWAGLMAGSLLAALPMAILMLFLGRRIVGSIQDSAVK